jgi:signal transduction histidine kinase
MFLLRDLVSPRTWLAMAQHLAGLLIGFVAIFIVTFGLGFGAGGLFFALVGLPLLGVTLRLAGWFAGAERARFAFFTGARIPAWPAPGSPGRAGFRWGIIPRWQTWKESATWSELGYALLRLPVSAAAAGISILVWSVGLIMLLLPAYAWALPSGGPTFGDTTLHGRFVLVTSALLGALLLLAAPQLTRGLAIADDRLARLLLGPRRDLAARVSELEISRERVVDAAEAERRRIERDLHDGAQQRLVALAMELGRARRGSPTTWTPPGY